MFIGNKSGVGGDRFRSGVAFCIWRRAGREPEDRTSGRPYGRELWSYNVLPRRQHLSQSNSPRAVRICATICSCVCNLSLDGVTRNLTIRPLAAGCRQVAPGHQDDALQPKDRIFFECGFSYYFIFIFPGSYGCC